MECVNLRERFGKRYRVRYEESYHAERGERAYTDDPWLMILVCQHGHFYPFGGTTLAASTNKGRGQVAHTLRRLPCCRIHQDGDDGLTVLLDLADFDKVAKILKPRRRRVLTEEQKAKLAAAGAQSRFSPASGAPPSGLERVGAALDGPESPRPLTSRPSLQGGQ